MKFIIALAASIANCASAIVLETKVEAKQSGFTPISLENLGLLSTKDASSDTPTSADQNNSTPVAAAKTKKSLDDISQPKITAETVIAQPLVVNE